MPIERKNSFHLLLSDDELKLLKLLAEREGLTASDYLRLLIRTLPTTSPQVVQAIRIGAALGGKFDPAKVVERYADVFRGTGGGVEETKRKKARAK